MKAIVITRPGGPEVLELRDVPDPVPGAEQVLVRVRATALNRADLLQRRGHYPAPPGAPADIPGLELAGEVVALGPGARERAVGDRVYGIVGGGAHAELVVAHERALAPIPDGLEWAEAAAVPEAFITAHDALRQAEARPGDSVLVHAVGSGVGLAAVQLARAFGAVPFGTSRTADKVERARAFGLEDGAAIEGDLGAIAERAQAWTGGAGVDVVLDLVGGDYTAASIPAMARQGRLILIGTMGGIAASVDLRRILAWRLTIRGTVLRARPIEEKILVTRRFAAEVNPFLARGALRPTIDSRFPLADAAAAHRRVEGNETFGKVVLEV